MCTLRRLYYSKKRARVLKGVVHIISTNAALVCVMFSCECARVSFDVLLWV